MLWASTRPCPQCRENDAGTNYQPQESTTAAGAPPGRQPQRPSGRPLFLGDGTKLLQEAMRWCDGLECVILADTLPIPAMPEQVAVYQVPEDVMQTISPMRAPQGAVFLCRLPEPPPLRLQPGTLILDGIQDPGNLGTILRTADALDTPVILTGACADPYNWKTVRASMGAIFRRSPMQATQEKIVHACQGQGIPLAVTALSERAMDIRQADAGACAVVIGSEGRGVSPIFWRPASRHGSFL